MSVELQIEMVKRDLLLCHSVVKENLDDLFATALEVGAHRKVWADRR